MIVRSCRLGSLLGACGWDLSLGRAGILKLGGLTGGSWGHWGLVLTKIRPHKELCKIIRSGRFEECSFVGGPRSLFPPLQSETLRRDTPRDGILQGREWSRCT